jgi:hypothetical protein
MDIRCPKKPDVFSIGSQWPYRFKKVAFSTDVNSISFNVQPGRKYDFVILLNERTPCHIQIATLANPVFMNATIVTLILTGFGLLFILLYVLQRRIDALPLLYDRYAVPLLFRVVTGISGKLHRDCHHLKSVISELGAIGTKLEVFTSSSFVVLAELSTLFSIGFYKASKTLNLSVVPAVLSFSKPLSLTWAAFFPLGNEFHNSTGPVPFLIVLASLSAFLLWKRGVVVSLRRTSLVCFFYYAIDSNQIHTAFWIDV